MVQLCHTPPSRAKFRARLALLQYPVYEKTNSFLQRWRGLKMNELSRIGLVLCASLMLAGCGALRSGEGGAVPNEAPTGTGAEEAETTESIWTLFRPPPLENTVLVNRYIWNASLEVLDFLPIQTVDPFTGVIVTGFGTPPGGGRAYRATILIDDPALDARSLNVALQTRSGPASGATVRAVEDAILTRARQLRISDSKL